MKKFLGIIILLVLCCLQTVQANNNTPEDLLERFKTNRNNIYSSLDLTNAQIKQINMLDKRVYKKLQPEMEQICIYINRIEESVRSGNCTEESINLIRKDFDSTEKTISDIKTDYEKNFVQILTKEQRIKYQNAKREQYNKLQQEMKLLKNNG